LCVVRQTRGAPEVAVNMT